MALLRPGRSSRRRLSLKGGAVLRVQQGNTYAQAWPRKRGKPRQKYQQAGLQRMRIAQRMVKHVHGDEVGTLQAGLDDFLARHKGVRGTAAIRLRDWMTQAVYGRAWALQTPEGETWWPATVQRDCSDFLDWIDPRPGSLVVRTGEAWLPTVNCKPGHVLTQTVTPYHPGACPPATIPPAEQALGGYPPPPTDASVQEPPPQPTPEEPETMPEDTFNRTAFPNYSRLDGLASWWMIRDNAMHAREGSQAILQRDDSSIGDGFVEVDCTQAHDGGFAARILDKDNYYLVTLSDDSGSNPGANVRLFKKVSGSFTNLADSDQSWGRGVLQTIRLELSGTQLTVFWNGGQIIQVTDSAIAGPGKVGLRHNLSDTPTIFDRLEWG